MYNFNGANTQTTISNLGTNYYPENKKTEQKT